MATGVLESATGRESAAGKGHKGKTQSQPKTHDPSPQEKRSIDFFPYIDANPSTQQN
ncbi:MAG: hypothetical protein AAFX06_17485 [Planctomycetota bacterium]